MSPQISSDGQKLVFVSARSGAYEVWSSKSDGSGPMQLTTFSGPFVGSPRWSPKGDFVAFDSNRSGSLNIYVVGAEGGRVDQITNDPSNTDSARPSWSRDGRWIYFGSTRSGSYQIWKAPVGGGADVPVTQHGGMEAFESQDGRHLYYAKPTGTSGIWRVPVNGGVEVQVIDHGRQESWGVTDRGIALMDKLARPQATIEYFDIETMRLTWTQRLPPGLRFDRNPSFAMSRDGRWMAWAQYDQWGSDIHMLQGSR